MAQCFMENSKGAFRHLWAAIQLLRNSEDQLSTSQPSNIAPLYDVMLRLDFIAQKLVPYARSSFLRVSDLAIMERPFWNRALPEFTSISLPDLLANERYRLIQLIAAHNKLSRVVWGCWCPINERPTRHELLGFYAEMQMWKTNSPATFANCDGLDGLEALKSATVESLPIPPPACHFLDNEAALNVAIFNGYLGCAAAMICATDEDPALWELEAYNLAYQNMCIATGLMDKHKQKLYKPCDSISMGISLILYHSVRRSFSLPWQEWTVAALRSIGREGLSNGFTSANTVEIMCGLEARIDHEVRSLGSAISPLGSLQNRLMPILMPFGDDRQILAFFLRYGNSLELDGDETAIQIVAKAAWNQDATGVMNSLKLDIYDTAVAGELAVLDRPDALKLFSSLRQQVENGWHGYLAPEVQDGFLKREGA